MKKIALTFIALGILLVPVASKAFTNIQGCTSSSGSLTCTMGVGVGATNLGVFFVSTPSGSMASGSFTDDKSDSCTIVERIGIITSVYCPNLTIGATAFTATLGSGAAANARVWGSEYSGILGTSPLDTHHAQSQTTPGTGANAISSGAATTTNPVDLIVSGTVNHTGSAGAGSISAGTGFTSGQSVTNLLRSEYITRTSTGSQAGTFTAGSASDSFDTAMMAFEPTLSSSKLNTSIVLQQNGLSSSKLNTSVVLEGTAISISKLNTYAVLAGALGISKTVSYIVLTPKSNSRYVIQGWP